MIFPESKKKYKNIQVIIKNNQIIREKKDNKRLRKIWIDNKREKRNNSSHHFPHAQIGRPPLQPPHHHHREKTAYNLFE